MRCVMFRPYRGSTEPCLEDSKHNLGAFVLSHATRFQTVQEVACQTLTKTNKVEERPINRT
jgi:hypothetical protein